MIIRSMTAKVALSPVPTRTKAKTAKRILKGFMSAENKGFNGYSAADLFGLYISRSD